MNAINITPQALAQAALARLCAEFAAMRGGGLKDKLRERACELGRYSHAGWVCATKVADELLKAANTNGLTQAIGVCDVAATIREGLLKATSLPRPAPLVGAPVAPPPSLPVQASVAVAAPPVVAIAPDAPGAVDPPPSPPECIAALMVAQNAKEAGSTPASLSLASVNLEAALALARAGNAVFPCGADKRPTFVASWPAFSTTDEKILREAFERHSAAVPAIDCGKSNLFVIDADRKPDAPDGVAHFVDLYAANNDTLSGVPRVNTPGGGVHYIFSQPGGDPLGNSPGGLGGRGIDARGVGGYILAPGATLPDGRRYAYTEGSVLLEDGPPPPPPQWLLNVIRAGRPPKRMAGDHHNGNGQVLMPMPAPPRALTPEQIEHAWNIARRSLARIADAPPGTSNDTINREAHTLAGLVAAGLPADGLREHALAVAMERAAKGGNDSNETRKTFDSAWRSGLTHPWAPKAGPGADAVAAARASAAPHLMRLNAEQATKQLGMAAKSDAAFIEAACETEAPRPLRRELSPAAPFPIDALGNVLGGATRAIVDITQCPDAIAGGSILAAAALTVQPHADVVLPATGRSRPLSLFVCTVAASGERKSAADQEALWPICKHEENMRDAYNAEMPVYKRAKRAWESACAQAEKAKGREAIEAALKAVGDEPERPQEPILTCGEPTLEGLHKLYVIGPPALGLFSDEGGSFISGHAMSEEKRLGTVAGLSSLWDGGIIKRVRAGDGASTLPGRRLALHLMAQPDAAARMLSDDVLVDQGFLSRVLVSAPASTAGIRFQREVKPDTRPALQRYGARLLNILETPPPHKEGRHSELDPRCLNLDDGATTLWREYADRAEARIGPGGELEPIKGFANKLAEHAARIAGVLTLVDDITARTITRETLARAITIADFYTTEALRLFEAGMCSPELRQAEKLLSWLKNWGEPLIGLSAIYRRGPNSIRDKQAAKAAVAILEDHGWLVREKAPATVEGRPIREAWRIVRET